MSGEDEFVSVSEWGRRVGVSKDSAYKAARLGQIPGCFAIGGRDPLGFGLVASDRGRRARRANMFDPAVEELVNGDRGGSHHTPAHYVGDLSGQRRFGLALCAAGRFGSPGSRHTVGSPQASCRAPLLLAQCNGFLVQDWSEATCGG